MFGRFYSSSFFSIIVDVGTREAKNASAQYGSSFDLKMFFLLVERESARPPKLAVSRAVGDVAGGSLSLLLTFRMDSLSGYTGRIFSA
jgi:hypothetical protein